MNFKGKKSPQPEKISAEDGTHNAASSRTASPTHYQQAIPAPFAGLIAPKSQPMCIGVRVVSFEGVIAGNDNNEHISRAPFHVKHAQLR